MAAIPNTPDLWLDQFPKPARDSHKYARGGVLVWSGPVLQTGAARLAARAALRIGAGAVTLVGERDALLVHAAHVSSIMLAEGDAPAFAQMMAGRKVKAACVGPGAGPRARQVATAALQAGKPLLLDADALTAFAGEADHLARLVRRGTRPVVVTPHEGEFTRLFPGLLGSKAERAVAAARQTGALVVLKGADAVIAAPGGRAAVVGNAAPWLATAGSGDVLAGFITGLMAQGMPGFEAACAGCWVHADLGTRLGAGLISEDLAGPAVGIVVSGLLERQAAADGA